MIAVHAQPAAFSPEECDRIFVIAQTAPTREARLVGQTQDHNLRRADLVWLDDVSGSAWSALPLIHPPKRMARRCIEYLRNNERKPGFIVL